MHSLCHVRNKIMYVLSWRTVSALTRVLFWYSFPSLLHNLGNKHQNNPLVSAETVRHSSTYIILYIPCVQCMLERQYTANHITNYVHVCICNNRYVNNQIISSQFQPHSLKDWHFGTDRKHGQLMKTNFVTKASKINYNLFPALTNQVFSTKYIYVLHSLIPLYIKKGLWTVHEVVYLNVKKNIFLVEYTKPNSFLIGVTVTDYNLAYKYQVLLFKILD